MTVVVLCQWSVLLADLAMLLGWQVGDVDFFGLHNGYLKLRCSVSLAHENVMECNLLVVHP
jgi:hypothetical protein